MIVLRWLWFLIGIGVMLEYLYWFAMIVSHAIGWVAEPHIPTIWLALAFAGAFLFSCESRADELKVLLD